MFSGTKSSGDTSPISTMLHSPKLQENVTVEV